jgi:hypothetical protein
MADARAKTANACLLHAVYRGSSIFAAVATVTHAPYCTAYLLSLLQYLLLEREREGEGERDVANIGSRKEAATPIWLA